MQGEGGQSPGATAVCVLARPSPVTTDHPGAQSAEGARVSGWPAGVGCARVWVGLGTHQPRVTGTDPAGLQGEVGRGVENCSSYLPGAARRPLPIVDCDAQGRAG